MNKHRHSDAKQRPSTAMKRKQQNMKPGLKSQGSKSRNQAQQTRAGSSSIAALADLPVAKNDETVMDIIDMNHDGEGVGRVDGYTLFVSGALPGEQVEVKVLKTKKQYGYAKLQKVLKPSPDRVAPPCEIYAKCGGCQLQHLSYEAQLDWKRQHVINALERIGKLKVSDDEGIKVLPTLGMAEPWRYRNKAQVPIGVASEQSVQGSGNLGDLHRKDTDGQARHLVGGFYAKGSHRIIDMETCLIQHKQNDEVIAQIKEIGRSLGIAPYNEETGQGLLRHVVVRIGVTTGEVMVVLVTNGDSIPKVDQWIQKITSQIPAVTSICQNVNTRRTNVIFGDVTRVLWGREVIYDYIGNVKFAISARSFYQVNPVQTEVLYQKTVDYAGLTGNETVIDAYCGIGTISLFLAQHAKQVYGVEIVPEAIEDARANAKLNGMSHVQFEVGASEDVIPRWKEQGIEADVIVVDPPRKGCDAKLLETIVEMKPKRVVYVSCNPATLARDLRVLEDGGYKAVEVQPVDMFPHTGHVECCALLVRSKD